MTLDGVERQLATVGRGLGDTGEDCVIVDGDDKVLGLAGIMGGAASEISDATTDVLLEAAYFDPMAIARSSKRHGLRTEGSNRFERGVDPAARPSRGRSLRADPARELPGVGVASVTRSTSPATYADAAHGRVLGSATSNECSASRSRATT